MENFLNTTLRNVSWFKAANDRRELEVKPSFQRNPVWVNRQKSFLIDTILNRYPIPEIYMQETVDSVGNQHYIIVDGQQRIRSVLEFIQGNFNLDEKESPEFHGAYFSDLTEEQKKAFFQYNFVVRILPDIGDAQLRQIFRRLNQNVVSLNSQELRQAVYSGPFIKLMNELSDMPFFDEANIFTANDIRRMLDVEFISELSIAFLNGIQNKKDKLENYYQLYEDEFDDSNRLKQVFTVVTSEIGKILPEIRKMRWRKKTDFYTLFLVFAEHNQDLPLSKDDRIVAHDNLELFGRHIDEIVRLSDEKDRSAYTDDELLYAKGSRASTDYSSRKVRHEALANLLDTCWGK